MAHASRLSNRAKEYGYAGSSECDPRAQPSAVDRRGSGARPRRSVASRPPLWLAEPSTSFDKASTLAGQEIIFRKCESFRRHDVYCKAFHGVRSEQRIDFNPTSF
jgi:hypothetical protein